MQIQFREVTQTQVCCLFAPKEYHLWPLLGYCGRRFNKENQHYHCHEGKLLNRYRSTCVTLQLTARHCVVLQVHSGCNTATYIATYAEIYTVTVRLNA